MGGLVFKSCSRNKPAGNGKCLSEANGGGELLVLTSTRRRVKRLEAMLPWWGWRAGKEISQTGQPWIVVSNNFDKFYYSRSSFVYMISARGGASTLNLFGVLPAHLDCNSSSLQLGTRANALRTTVWSGNKKSAIIYILHSDLEFK